MGFPNGDIKLSANFELNVSKPLDSRNKVTNYSDLTNINFKYAGMIVFVTATNKHYGLKNDLTTWSEFNMGTSGSGGGGGASSAGNGLSISSGVIQLGGTLTKTLTSINLNNKALRFVNGANTLFNVDEGLLYDNANKESVDTVNRFLKDNTETLSIFWQARKLVDNAGGAALDWANKNTGLGISSNSMWGYFKSDLINTTNKTFQLPNKNGTVMLTSDLYQSGTNFFLPISGGTMLGNVTMGYNTLLKGTSKTTPSFGNQLWNNTINLSNNGTMAGMRINSARSTNPFTIYSDLIMGNGFYLTSSNVSGYHTCYIQPTGFSTLTNYTANGGGQSNLESSSRGISIYASNSDSNPYTQHHAYYQFQTDRFSFSTKTGYTGLYGQRFAHIKTDNLVQFDRIYQMPDKSGTFALLDDITGGSATAGNGLHTSGDVVKLGGAITEDTGIISNVDGQYAINLGANSDYSNISRLKWLEVFSVVDNILLTGVVGGENGLGNGIFYQRDYDTFMNNQNSSGFSGWVNNWDSGFGIRTSKPNVVHAFLRTDNLSADRTVQFPDKSGTFAFLDDITGGGNTTAGNGLSLSGNSIELGGVLSHNTAIDSNTDGGRTLVLGASNKLSFFEAYTRDDIWFENQNFTGQVARLILDNQGISLSTTSGYGVSLRTDNLTNTQRKIQFPDKDGTIALREDINGKYLLLSGGTMGGAIDLNLNQLNRVKEISNNASSGALIDMNYSGGNILLLSGNKANTYPYVALFKTPNQINLENSVSNGLIINDVQGAFFKNDLRLISADNQNFATFKQPNNLTDDRNYIFPDVSGTILVDSNTIINNTYYVSVQYGNDTTGQKGNILKPYKSIKEAVTQSTAGDVVHVFSGIYDEHTIPTKSYLTIHLEDGVRIIPTDSDGKVPIFTDLALGQAAYNFRITGKGEILGKGLAFNDATCLVASFADSKYFVEAKKVRSLEAWGQTGAYIYMKDCDIDYQIAAYLGGEAYFENCKFVNLGGPLDSYSDTLNSEVKFTFKNCYFERNGTNGDFVNSWTNDTNSVLYLYPYNLTVSPKCLNIIFDNCEFVQKMSNYDIFYVQSGLYDTTASLQFTNCKFYNYDLTKKSIVYTTDANFHFSSTLGSENGNLKFFFDSNITNVDVDNVNVMTNITNELPSSGILVNSNFRRNSKFIA